MEEKSKTPAERAAEQVLNELERQRKAKEAARPENQIKILDTGISRAQGIYTNSNDAIRHKIVDVTPKGDRRQLIGSGIPSGYSREALVLSNHRSLMNRGRAALSASRKLQDLITTCRSDHKKLPPDCEAYVEKIIAEIPEADETLVIVQSPAENTGN